MDGQPAAPTCHFDEPVGDAGGQEGPVARLHGHPLASHLQDGSAGEEERPLVLVLEIVLGLDVGPAQDLLDDEVADANQLLGVLAGGRRVGGGPQGAPARRSRNG